MTAMRVWLVAVVMATVVLGGCRTVASAWIRHGYEPEKHFTLVLTAPAAEYTQGAKIPARIVLTGVDSPLESANYRGDLVLKLRCGDKTAEHVLGRIQQRRLEGRNGEAAPVGVSALDLDLSAYLPELAKDALCSAEVCGDFRFYPPEGSQFPAFEEYASKAKLRSNDIRFVVRPAPHNR